MARKKGVKAKTFRGVPKERIPEPPAILPANEHIVFEKIPDNGMVFSCSVCDNLRMYGRANMLPENVSPLLICHRDHSTKDHKDYRAGNEHFVHYFAGIMRGGKVIIPEVQEDFLHASKN